MMLPTAEHFGKHMAMLDVRKSDKVVCYDTSPRNVFGFRTAWMFHAMGHPDVQVLDGGFEKWLKEGLPVESSEVDPEWYSYKL